MRFHLVVLSFVSSDNEPQAKYQSDFLFVISTEAAGEVEKSLPHSWLPLAGELARTKRVTEGFSENPFGSLRSPLSLKGTAREIM